MKEFDKFEEFIENNKDQFFVEEPKFGHFNRFTKRLEDLHEQHNKKGISKNKSAFIIAASVALVALLSIPLLNISSDQFSQKQIDAVDEQLSTSIRESLKSPVMQANFESEEAFQATLSQVTELEMEYVRLKHMYNSSNHCNNVLSSMKDNLEARLAILDCLNKQDGSPVIETKFVHENYLLKHISDCYSEPEFIERSPQGQFTSVNY